MADAVGVSFRPLGRQYWFDASDLELHVGDRVIVETAKGLELGVVRTARFPLADVSPSSSLKPILRVATEDDEVQIERNAERAETALRTAIQRVRHHGLPMKILSAEFSFDGSQVVICFAAESRIDFRELVRDLVGLLRCRVQLYQVGARDQARLIGGCGTCGRELCCRAFLTDFAPISMRMAKDQSLFLNPAKFSGACGKLMCCLRYEHEVYVEARDLFPCVGSHVTTPKGPGRVSATSVIRGEVTVALEDSEVEVTVPLHQVTLPLQSRRVARDPAQPCGEPPARPVES